METALIVPVTWRGAIAWARGEASDVDLMLFQPDIPQAILFACLPSLGAFKDALDQMLYLRSLGAQLIVMRTGTPVVARHFQKWGGFKTFDEGTKARYLGGPEATNKFFAQFGM